MYASQTTLFQSKDGCIAHTASCEQILSSLFTNNYKPRILTGSKLLENNQVLIIVLNDFKFQNQTILYSFDLNSLCLSGEDFDDVMSYYIVPHTSHYAAACPPTFGYHQTSSFVK